MRDLVLVPTFARPEYLYLCLEHLAKADGGSEKHVWIAQDAHMRDSDETKQLMAEAANVSKKFDGAFASLRFIQRFPHTYVGNVFNVLELYKAAFESDARLVYLVEDDVCVGKDFFRWHEAVQAKARYLCSVGWHCIRNPQALTIGDPGDYIESSHDFSSIGVCWKREHLRTISPHASPEYYKDLPGYLSHRFPESETGIPHNQWTEQAGLVMRILLMSEAHEDDPWKVAWPVLARCAHIGISGYHRACGHRFTGSLEQRIAALRVASSDTQRLIGMSRDPFDDVAALPDVGPWSELRVVQRFERAGCNQENFASA